MPASRNLTTLQDQVRLNFHQLITITDEKGLRHTEQSKLSTRAMVIIDRLFSDDDYFYTKVLENWELKDSFYVYIMRGICTKLYTSWAPHVYVHFNMLMLHIVAVVEDELIKEELHTINFEQKYEFTNETLTLSNGTVVKRIRAVRKFSDVKKGDLGGFIAREGNLSHFGDCWVYGDTTAYGEICLSGNDCLRPTKKRRK